MVPSIALIEGALRDANEEKKDVIKLKLNKTFSIFQVLLFIGSLLLGIVFLVLPFLVKIYWLLILSPLGILFLADFIFTLNHLIVELTRKIYWHRHSNEIELKENGKSYRISKTDIIKAIAWVPRFSGVGELAPGELLGKYQFYTKEFKVEISDKIISNYPEIIESFCPEIVVRKRQFNLVKNTMPNNGYK